VGVEEKKTKKWTPLEVDIKVKFTFKHYISFPLVPALADPHF
jgi:hypothetical protein